MSARSTAFPGRTIRGMLIVGLSLLPGLVLAQEPVAQSGAMLYRQYCASCHGAGGRGDGPVASSLRVEVPDLTRLATRQGGFFNRDRVERIIDGRFVIGAHGSRTMPIWGEALSRSAVGDPDAERATRTIVVRLADYLWQLQRPSPPPQ